MNFRENYNLTKYIANEQPQYEVGVDLNLAYERFIALFNECIACNWSTGKESVIANALFTLLNSDKSVVNVSDFYGNDLVLVESLSNYVNGDAAKRAVPYVKDGFSVDIRYIFYPNTAKHFDNSGWGYLIYANVNDVLKYKYYKLDYTPTSTLPEVNNIREELLGNISGVHNNLIDYVHRLAKGE